MAKKKNLTPKQQFKAIAGVAKLSFRTAPGAVIFKLAGAVFSAVLPIVTTYFAALTTTALASAYAGDPTAGRQAIMYVIVTALLGLLMTVWRSIDQYIQAQMRYRVEAKVGDMMYTHFLNLDFWHYDDKDTADLYERAQKFAQFFAWVFDRIASIISQFIMMTLGVAALALVSGWIALIVLIAIIPGVYIQIKLSRAQIAHWNKNVDVRRAKGNIEWNLLQPKSIAELRLYGLVDHLLKLRAFLRDKDEKARLDFERSYIPKRLMADALEAGAEVVSLIWITLQIINRAQPIGQFLYVQQIVSRAIGAASGFVSELSSIDEDIANLYDYEQFMQLPARSGGGKKLESMPSRIEVNNVSFKYRSSSKFVLNNINFVIEQGTHVAIVGENGAGKSTLIKILAGLYAPTSGSVTLDGTDLKDYDINSWHRHLSVLQQDFLHYTFATAKENIIFGDVDKKYDRKNINNAMERAEATEFVNELPKKLDNYVSNWMEDDEGNKGNDLSGGQWQRLALARNFYRDAPIVILDEPTSAIDALAESRIFKRLFAEEKRTIITISHRLTTIEKADVIYMLEDGRIVESGTHEQLLHNKKAYFRMFEGQLQKAVKSSLSTENS